MNEQITPVQEEQMGEQIHKACYAIYMSDTEKDYKEVGQAYIDSVADALDSPNIKDVAPETYTNWYLGELQEQEEQALYVELLNAMAKMPHRKPFASLEEKRAISQEVETASQELYSKAIESNIGLYSLQKSVYRPIMERIAGIFSYLESSLSIDSDIAILKHLQLQIDAEDLSRIPAKAMADFIKKTEEAYREKYPLPTKEDEVES